MAMLNKNKSKSNNLILKENCYMNCEEIHDYLDSETLCASM